MQQNLYYTFVLTSSITSFACADDAWVIDSHDEWEKATSAQKGLAFAEGMAEPAGKEATFQSVLKRFETKRSVKSISIAQSPNWLNWEETPNIGTASMADAPVLLSLGENNHWMFARYKAPGSESQKGKKDKKGGEEKVEVVEEVFVPEEVKLEGFDVKLLSTPVANEFTAPGGLEKNMGGYHAWQSRDMKNWVRHGSVTEKFSKWMTTAEYVDGKFQFYYDFPNDQDPHVYVDEDLTDGKPGKNMGMAFKDPSHGSDVGMIRDLEGKFHVIYEDWSPIKASARAWDSPLAGHAVSEDGLKDFKIVDAAVDLRTKPTGKIGTYKHPHWAKEDPKNYKTNVAEYEIHSPEQPAFGDWAAISVGGQYYLFGDYDKSHGEPMSVGMFTSSSIDKQFTFFGSIGRGHPDPDVCFADGKFYLATQQKLDFVSDGPWVESVEVRAGVDTDNDATIDQWSEWQMVKEAYAYTPGFAKQVKKTAAEMDLSKLPEGYGFQFELRLKDTTENQSKPILDKVTVEFGE
ncbi:MAG: hypothetical protein ACSHX6_04160 [Akkermansiaceae bacterium]